MATKTENIGNAFGLIGLIGLPLLMLFALIQSKSTPAPEEEDNGS